MSTTDSKPVYLPRQDEAIDPVLEELGSILLDCLRLNRSSAKATTHILEAINARVLETHISERLPSRTDQSLQPWQEIMATGLLLAPSSDRTTIQTIAVACGVTTTQFSRAFKAQFGQSPQQWRLDARIERAKKLMHETTLSLTTIAIDCGFAEQSHFNHTFLKRVGVSPSAWRKQRAQIDIPTHILDSEMA
jgi:AraC-like DNA-binding protein